MKKPIKIIIAVLLLAVLMACAFTPNLDWNTPGVVDTLATKVPEIVSPNIPPVFVNAEDLANVDQILTTLYERVNPGVVTIIASTSQGEGSGSGFVYDYDGHIITNYHVVEGAQTIEVDFASGLKVYGQVIASDLDSDIAVIKVEVPASELAPLTMGDSDALKVGQMVVAIGNPYRLTSTMTLGVVSAKGRILDSLRTTEDFTSYTAGDLIQTDAAINPGNSGGPLLNLAGEVVGVNRAIRTESSNTTGEPVNAGIGFAVSSRILARVVPVLIRDGKYEYPYLGVTSQDELSLFLIEELNLPQTTGAYIASVTAGSPADQAGLRGGSIETTVPNLLAGGDLIVAVDGRPVRVFGDMLGYLVTNKSPGDTVVMTIIRDGEQKEVTVTLGKRP